jgi:hypothetical protein
MMPVLLYDRSTASWFAENAGRLSLEALLEVLDGYATVRA